MMRLARVIWTCVIALLCLASCEGDHEVIETDWTTLETVELQKRYNKYMAGDWVYQYDDSTSYIEMYYTFNTKDSTVTGYYNELIYTALGNDEEPEWQLLWQGEFSAKWALLHSVELDHDYICMWNMVRKNVHGLLADYDVLTGRILFYGANKNTLRVTTPLTFRRIDMHHPNKP